MKNLTLAEIQNFKGKYPKQIWSLFFSEMWERFCFYGMRGMLTYFMVYELFMKDDTAQLQYGAIQAFVYAFTFIGGLFADKILGFRKSLFWGAILMITGSCILAYNPHQFFFLGISFTVIGTGFFKPNISTMVGQLYKDGDERRDAGFSLFYSGINLGALLGGAICIYLGKHYSWNWAFGMAAVVMTISLVNFIFTKKKLGPIGLSPLELFQQKNGALGKEYETFTAESLGDTDNDPAAKCPKKWHEYAVYILSLAAIPLIMTMVSKTEYTNLFMYIVGPLTLIYLFWEMAKCTHSERKKLGATLVFIVFSILFWAIYEQAGGSLSLFAARNLNNRLLGITVDPNSINNAANSLFVIILAFLFSLLWLALAKKKKEPNSVVKFGLGFLFLGAGFFLFYLLRFFAGTDGVSSLNMFVVAYLVVTCGELALSPIGLSLMTKLSPMKLQGVMMGMWFLASAYGQYLAGILGAGLSHGVNEKSSNYDYLIEYTAGYRHFAIYALIAGVVLIAISSIVRKLMQEVK